MVIKYISFPRNQFGYWVDADWLVTDDRRMTAFSDGMPRRQTLFEQFVSQLAANGC